MLTVLSSTSTPRSHIHPVSHHILDHNNVFQLDVKHGANFTHVRHCSTHDNFGYSDVCDGSSSASVIIPVSTSVIYGRRVEHSSTSPFIPVSHPAGIFTPVSTLAFFTLVSNSYFFIHPVSFNPNSCSSCARKPLPRGMCSCSSARRFAGLRSVT